MARVNLLGLTSFGQNPGMNPIFGTLIGGGVSVATTLAIRHTGASSQPEAIGLLAGIGASAAMYAMKSTRHAAIGSLVGSFLASGAAWLERVLLGTATVATSSAAASGVGYPNVRALGIPSVRQLGMASMHNVTSPVGVAGNQMSSTGLSAPPVSLLGTNPKAGGPMVHGLSAAYGANLLGMGR